VVCPALNPQFNGIYEGMDRSKYFKENIIDCINHKTPSKFSKESIYAISPNYLKFIYYAEECKMLFKDQLD
jgi:hypothetical protein